MKWASSTPARVTIDGAGVATAVAYGTVTISGIYVYRKAETSFSVVNQTVAISPLLVTPQNPKIPQHKLDSTDA